MSLLPHVAALNQKRVILASASPRRRELLGNLGLKFEVLASTFDETLPHSQFAGGAAYALATAKHKGLDIASTCGEPKPHLVISADTVVEHEGKILEKPRDAEDAFQVLSRLSGHRHQVHTGVVLILPRVTAPGSSEPYVHAFSATTDVEFDELSSEAISAYVASGEPFGKAGSYGIQGLAGCFVKRLEGDYFNVVGFPVHRFSVEVACLVAEGVLDLAS